MKYDIILAGVGGQGVLSVAAIIAKAAMMEGLEVRQSEVHGMAQRGGAVLSHLRIADQPIPGDLVPRGGADLILSMEPLECLRYTDYLKPQGAVVTSGNPVVNIPNYPELDEVLAKVRALPSALIVDDKTLAREAGNPRGANMVIVGAASSQIPLGMEALFRAVEALFGAKGEEIVATNHRALELGALGAK